MNSKRIIIGQILLVICCIFYLSWWSISYKPGESVDRLAGINGILLFITAVCGISGVILSVNGLSRLKLVQSPRFSGIQIVSGGVVAYVVLLLITYFGLHRPVTTELVLITGWAVLETAVVNSLNAAGILTDTRFYTSLIIIAIAFVLSMILYVLYYRMQPWKAFYAAMVPLVTEAVSMFLIILISL